MPVVDFISSFLEGITVAQGVTLLVILIWLIQGGFWWILRHLSFAIDKSLIGIMGSVYNIFEVLLSGKMFSDDVLNQVLRNVYVFIGVIMFFRLVMVLMKYLLNPELTSDDKAGVNSLVKRVVIGSMGILFIPMLFSLMNDFQASFLKDQVIQQVLIPKDLLNTSQRMHQQGGRFIGTYVLSGFLNPNPNASTESINQYNMAINRGDIGGINLNKGKVLGNLIGTYEYEYMILVSTLVLGYTLFLLLDYALDVAVRFFKLFLYQILAPVAMIEYMIAGSDTGMFKAWKDGVLSSYFMLFTRIFSVWFVVFIMSLMSDDSLATGTLLAEKDFLLRALIIIAALGFMKDLPKILGELFGLDFEQASSAKEIANSVKGMAKGIGMAGLGLAGGLTGTGIGMIKSQTKGAGDGNARERAKRLRSAMGGGLQNMGQGLMGSTAAGKAFAGGFVGAREQQDKYADKRKLQQAIAEKRDQMPSLGSTDETDKTIRAIQELELRVAGEKLGAANQANAADSSRASVQKDQQLRGAASPVASNLTPEQRMNIGNMDQAEILASIANASGPETNDLDVAINASLTGLVTDAAHATNNILSSEASFATSEKRKEPKTYNLSDSTNFETVAATVSSQIPDIQISGAELAGDFASYVSTQGIDAEKVTQEQFVDFIVNSGSIADETKQFRDSMANEILSQTITLDTSFAASGDIRDTKLAAENIEVAAELTMYETEDIRKAAENIEVATELTMYETGDTRIATENIEAATELTMYEAGDINQNVREINENDPNNPRNTP